MNKLSFRIELKPPIQSPNPANQYSVQIFRWHWTRRIKNSELYKSKYQFNGASDVYRYLITKAKIRCVWFSAGQKKDFDNLVFYFKPMLNALVFLEILEDDSPRHIEISYAHEWAPRGEKEAIIFLEVLEYALITEAA